MINDRMKVIATQQSQNLVLKGKTIKYNNLVQNGNFASVSAWSGGSATYYISNNVATITPTAIHSSFRQTITGINGHKYFCHYEIKYTLGETYIENILNVQVANIQGTGNFEKVDRILTPTNTNNQINFYDYDSTIHSAFQLRNVILIDLTLLGLDNITTTAQFYATDLGKFIQSGAYLPYSANNTIYNVKTPFTFKNGIKYNNLVPNANRNFSNTTTDQRSDDNFNFTIFDFSNSSYLSGKTIRDNGFKNVIFSNQYDTNGVSIYHSGSTRNIDFAQNLVLKANHKYWCSFNCVSHDSRVVGGIVLRNILLIDLTLLGMDSITTYDEFLRTDLGKAIKNGLVLPYSVANAEIDAITPTTYIRTKRVDLGTLNWNRISGVFYASKPSDYSNGKAICPKYTKSNLSAPDNPNKTFTFNGGDGTSIWIKDNDYTDKNVFKTSLNGVILEYETLEQLELYGIGNNYDTFETKSGKVVSKLIKVNLASLTWTQYETHLFGAQNTQINLVAPTTLPNAICSAYQVVKSNDIRNYQQAITIDGQNLRGIGIIDNSVSSVAQLVSKLANEIMICERSVLEPILETTERSVLVDHRYTNVVDANGNEIDTD